jgi:NADPH-dependent 2,4-dienoyl-CoA reductase/sulfur reductase-like enzyme
MSDLRQTIRRSYDIVIVGAGPAGIAAAVCAGSSGKRIALIDDNPAIGGQIWRRGVTERADADADACLWRRRLAETRVDTIVGTRIVHQPDAGVLLAESDDDVYEIRHESLIVATGARERFLPFPGWTLPNVMGAGGLQAMVKNGLPIRGKRVAIAGSGPLLLAVASYLRHKGARIVGTCEQAPFNRLARFALSLTGSPEKLVQAIGIGTAMLGIPLRPGTWPIAAIGNDKVDSVRLTNGKSSIVLACDYLACGFHMVPNIELASLLGCRILNGFVDVDQYQGTSVEGVYCAGEPTGIGGVEKSLVEGKIAGYSALGRHDAAEALWAARAQATRFSTVLADTFELRPELKHVCLPDTIVCRCEDVRFGALGPHQDWRSGKLHTRCGMGPCQGRICGPATELLLGWKPDSVRPPLFPTQVSTLMRDIHEISTITDEGINK